MKRKPAASKPRVPVTALVRRLHLAQGKLSTYAKQAKADKLAVPAPGPVLAPSTLGDEAAIGQLGLVEVHLSEREEAILAEPVPIAAIRIKPTGQPYLSHPDYTRWFGRAFGRTGWAMVPASKPLRSGNSVVCPYNLYIHGQPVAFAMGEQEYHENNKEQTYGDALEATVASALRRCAKRLGVGLELWDRPWLDAFIREHCLHVKIQLKGGELKWVWRRRTDPPFWNEQLYDDPRHAEEAQRRPAPPSQPASRQAAQPAKPAGSNPKSGALITEGQLKRLWTIIRSTGRDEIAIKAWLKLRYNLESTKDITRRDYDAICTAIESPAQLPVREPGEDA